MQFKISLVLIASCAATSIHGMDSTSPRSAHPELVEGRRNNSDHTFLSAVASSSFPSTSSGRAEEEAPKERRRVEQDQKALAIRAQCATMCWLQNADPRNVHIDGLPRELSTTENKTALQQAVLSALTTVSLQFALPWSKWPTPTIDMQKLYAIGQAIEQIRTAEAELKEKQRLEAIERTHHASITFLLEFYGPQSGFDYCREQKLPAWKYLPAVCDAIGDNR